MNKDKRELARQIQDELGVSKSVASELAYIGDDLMDVVDASDSSTGLNLCKAMLIDKRFKRMEEKLK